MRENFAQTGKQQEGERRFIGDDWYPRGIPANVAPADSAYIDTSYCFAAFNSTQPRAMTIGEASGCYDRSTFITGASGIIKVGSYCILNGTTLISQNRITMGDHCMLSWGSVVMDSYIPATGRSELLKHASGDPRRPFPFGTQSKPVVLADNCWVGFGAVILPGVTLGRGCIIACKTIILENVPAYAVMAGNPARVVRYLQPDDTEEQRQEALQTYT